MDQSKGYDPSEFEYGAIDFSSINHFEVQAQNELKIVVPDFPAPFAAGRVAAASNDNDASDLYPSDPKVLECDDVNPPSAGV